MVRGEEEEEEEEKWEGREGEGRRRKWERGTKTLKRQSNLST